MTIRCVGCGRTIPVPPDKAVVPNLRVKCRCGAAFLVSEAPRVDDPVSAVPVAAPAPVPVPAPVRAPVPVPAPVPVSARPPRPAPPPARAPIASSPATASAPAAPARPVSWRRCASHPVRSHSVCPACVKGFCEPCAASQTVQNAVVCPTCDGLCVSAAEYDQRQARGQQQARSLMQELGTIVAYPLRDPVGFLMLSAFTWFFGVLAKIAIFGGGIAIVLSQGVLLSYCFFAVSRVASGNLHDFMPDFRGISDFIDPLRLGVAVLLISAGPLLAMTILIPGVAMTMTMTSAEAPAPGLAVVHAQPPPEPSPEAAEEPDEADAESASPSAEPGHRAAREEEDGKRLRGPARATSALLFLLFGLALLWKLVYTPVALTVAALSRGFFKTLNPVLGVDTIRRMGGIYWQALLIYSVMAGAQWVLGLGLGFIPIAGGIVKAFVDAYAYLAVGCTLGLAVFKKARELGWD